MRQEAKRHHFVPKFLLRPWLVDHPKYGPRLDGYWWDARRQQLSCKQKGLNSFCLQIDLLTLDSHHEGRDALERVFFGDIDAKGATARDKLLAQGPTGLSSEERCDFARLILSLDVRRPTNVSRLASDGRRHLVAELNADHELLRAMKAQGIRQAPADYVETQLGWSLTDRALSMVQALVDNPKVGERLINAHWAVKRCKPDDGSLVLSDRPLVRLHGYDHPHAIWMLPLSPNVAFIAANNKTDLGSLLRPSGQRFVKKANLSSVAQTDRFVFSVDHHDRQWLYRHLRLKPGSGPPP